MQRLNFGTSVFSIQAYHPFSKHACNWRPRSVPRTLFSFVLRPSRLNIPLPLYPARLGTLADRMEHWPGRQRRHAVGHRGPRRPLSGPPPAVVSELSYIVCWLTSSPIGNDGGYRRHGMEKRLKATSKGGNGGKGKRNWLFPEAVAKKKRSTFKVFVESCFERDLLEFLESI